MVVLFLLQLARCECWGKKWAELQALTNLLPHNPQNPHSPTSTPCFELSHYTHNEICYILCASLICMFNFLSLFIDHLRQQMLVLYHATNSLPPHVIQVTALEKVDTMEHQIEIPDFVSHIIACHGDDNGLGNIHTTGHSSIPVRLAQTESGTKAHAHTVGALG